MLTGAASVKKFNETAKKNLRVRFPIGYNFIPRNTMGRTETRTSERYLHIHIHSQQSKGSNKPSLHQQRNASVKHGQLQSGILANFRKDGKSDTHYRMAKSEDITL